MTEVTREQAMLMLDAIDKASSKIVTVDIRAYIAQLELQVNYWKTRHKLLDQRVKVLTENLSEATNLISNVEADYGWFAFTRKFKAALANKEQS